MSERRRVGLESPDEGGGDGFLGRWSRRKLQARREVAEPPPEALPPAVAAEPEPDLEALPPVESLDEQSDYTAFLKRGVPAALRHAALRKAWATDPVIAGHRPLVDYDWDFHAPGYGKLWEIDDPKAMVEKLFRHLTRPEEARAPAPLVDDCALDVVTPPQPPRAELPLEPVEEPAAEEPAAALPAPGEAPLTEAPAPEPEPVRQQNEPVRRRRHGGALPG
ncbi:MAG TPA: DUF3306 domain-containing protein [Azospirillaceae bacterium]|nr:DUF3306 domain-containing protein [Azospirillaceae bacterium]